MGLDKWTRYMIGLSRVSTQWLYSADINEMKLKRCGQ